MTPAEKRNAKILFHILVRRPSTREYVEEVPYEMQIIQDAKETGLYNYTFHSNDVQSASKLVGMCNKFKLSWKYTMRGIEVKQATNKQINKMRAFCNKTRARSAIKL